ncbi:MAG: hypothetical protein AB1611_08705 [bacterium]
MKKAGLYYLITLTAIATGIFLYSPVHAQDSPLLKDFTFSADYAYYTKYVSKGFTWDNDPALQAGFYMGFHGLTLTVWDSMDIRNQEGVVSDEVDYVAEYAYSIKRLKLSIGHAYFDYPGTNLFSREISAGVAYDILLSPSLSWKIDYSDEKRGGADGNYVAVAIAHSFPAGKLMSVDLSGHVGYNDGYFIRGKGGDVALTAGLSIPLTDKLTFKPNINYALPYADQADEQDGNQDSRVFAGVVMGYSL